MEAALESGFGAHLEVNLIDIAPVGEPWPTLEGFFNSERPRAAQLAIAVNDGLRKKLRLQGGWSVHSLRGVIERYGNASLFGCYLDVCRWKLEQMGARQDYRMTHWTGYYCGAKNEMTHYAAVLERRVAKKRKAKNALELRI